ncbi:hypothetical protein ARMGADRAFT_1091558 [Armillaria gallica]|uniref:Uncharacterized protein n=1 Tax=Armillaria gallica TaxID=47427 RepID=A0A2H3CH02_ARMGA|nr:hypothetical protein ARMGADRAFT_1091558 [Armillaria gallica]
MSAKDTGASNPWTIILHCLMGVGLSKPHKPQAFALWYKSNNEDVEAAWNMHMEELKNSGKPIAPGKHAMAFQTFKSKMYHNLSIVERKSWEDLAVGEHEVALKKFEEKLDMPILQESQDLQNCLEQLPSIIKPLTNVIIWATGCPVSIYVGGLQPADGGRLHISS